MCEIFGKAVKEVYGTIDFVQSRRGMEMEIKKIKQEESLNTFYEENLKIKDLKEILKDTKKFSIYLDKYNTNKGNFELIDYLDSGSESNVFIINIFHKNRKGNILKQKAVMKSIFYQKKERENKKEIIILSKLKNKNIIDYYGSYPIKKGQSYYLSMEFAKYGNLRNFQRNILKRVTLNEYMLCFFGSQILNALSYCHKCKIAHMDIKFQNVVIDDYLNAKLIDFSISLNYEDKRPNDELKLTLKGTNFFMPKEVLQSERIKYKDLNKVDLYAFGVILYNLAFGQYPYGLTHGDENNYDVILEKIKGNELNLNNEMNYSKHFLDFLKSLLEKDIDKRIGLNKALQHYWIKGADLLNEEKEKYYKVDLFLIHLLTGCIKSFNDYLNNQNDGLLVNEEVLNSSIISSNLHNASYQNNKGIMETNVEEKKRTKDDKSLLGINLEEKINKNHKIDVEMDIQTKQHT